MPFRSQLIGVPIYFWVCALETGPPSVRKGRAARSLCAPGPPRERRRLLAQSFRRILGPQTRHHTQGRARCAEGGARGWGERFYSSVCAVCLPPEGWVLLIHRWVTPWNAGSLPVRTESGRRVDKTTWSRKRKALRSAEWEPPAARRRAATPAAAEGTPARPGHACALAQLLPLLLAAPACRLGHLQEGRWVGCQEETSQPQAVNWPFRADCAGCRQLPGCPLCRDLFRAPSPTSPSGFPRDGGSLGLVLLYRAVSLKKWEAYIKVCQTRVYLTLTMFLDCLFLIRGPCAISSMLV